MYCTFHIFMQECTWNVSYHYISVLFMAHDSIISSTDTVGELGTFFVIQSLSGLPSAHQHEFIVPSHITFMNIRYLRVFGSPHRSLSLLEFELLYFVIVLKCRSTASFPFTPYFQRPCLMCVCVTWHVHVILSGLLQVLLYSLLSPLMFELRLLLSFWLVVFCGSRYVLLEFWSHSVDLLLVPPFLMYYFSIFTLKSSIDNCWSSSCWSSIYSCAFIASLLWSRE